MNAWCRFACPNGGLLDLLMLNSNQKGIIVIPSVSEKSLF